MGSCRLGALGLLVLRAEGLEFGVLGVLGLGRVFRSQVWGLISVNPKP